MTPSASAATSAVTSHEMVPSPEACGRLARAAPNAGAFARVIVDSSKRPSYAAFLRSVPGCDPYYVHLIREPRASAYSWQSRRYQSAQGQGVEVTRRGPLDSTLRWSILNLESEGLLQIVQEVPGFRVEFGLLFDKNAVHGRLELRRRWMLATAPARASRVSRESAESVSGNPLAPTRARL